MKKCFFTLLFTSVIFTVLSQHTIKILIKENDSKIMFLDKNGNEFKEYSKLDLLDGNGKILIENQANSGTYAITFKNTADKTFKIPSAEIPTKGNQKEYRINKEGRLINTPGNVEWVYYKGMAISLDGTDSPHAKVAEIIVDTKNKEEDEQEKNKVDKSLYAYVNKKVKKGVYSYNKSQNLLIDENNVIHIFLDENMNPIYTYFPTTAKEGVDKFQFHILSSKKFKYAISSAGEFNPVAVAEDIPAGGFAKVQSRGGDGEEDIYEFFSPIFGVFTGTFPFEIQKIERKGDAKVGAAFSREINLLKVSRVSLNIGVVNSWLRNPERIELFKKPNGDTTLIADNPTTRSFLSALLTFHLIPRNINIPPRNWKERLGLSFGTNLRGTIGNDWFFGVNLELATGLFVNGGIHLGQVNYPINKKKFDFGEEKFSGELITKKRTATAPYLSVVVDAALFVKAFKNLLSNSGAQ